MIPAFLKDFFQVYSKLKFSVLLTILMDFSNWYKKFMFRILSDLRKFFDRLSYILLLSCVLYLFPTRANLFAEIDKVIAKKLFKLFMRIL